MSVEVDHALDLMEQSFPLTPEDLKRRYRELAKQWHPDLNPDDPKAHDKMTAFNAAVEALTGIEASSIPRYAGVTFMREMDRKEFTVEGMTFTATMSMVIPEIHASDWIYAASFAATSNAVYLAGYSGRVVLVNENGEGLRAYDIGSVISTDPIRRVYSKDDTMVVETRQRRAVVKGVPAWWN